jgi:hypothetical protein
LPAAVSEKWLATKTIKFSGAPIAEAVHCIKVVEPNSQMVLTSRAVGMSFGD